MRTISTYSECGIFYLMISFNPITPESIICKSSDEETKAQMY